MRRVLALAVLATPALALAQASGAVDVVTSSSDPDDAFINIDECNGVGPTGPLSLRWNVALETGFAVTDGEYRIFASNKAPGTTAPRYCQDHVPADGTFTVEIVPPEPATLGSTFGDGAWPTADFAAAASFTCTEGQGDQTIHVCVEYHPTGEVRHGGAVRTLTLSLRRPATPTGVSATPGEGALNVTWSAGSGGAETRFYRVVVKDAGSVVSTSDDINATSLRVEGLQNGTTYDVEVFALSEAKNLSATPGTTTGTPVPVDDFWEVYNRRCEDDPATPAIVEGCPDREEGGCGAGGAGPLGLLAVAGFLAALRRRK